MENRGVQAGGGEAPEGRPIPCEKRPCSQDPCQTRNCIAEAPVHNDPHIDRGPGNAPPIPRKNGGRISVGEKTHKPHKVEHAGDGGGHAYGRLKQRGKLRVWHLELTPSHSYSARGNHTVARTSLRRSLRNVSFSGVGVVSGGGGDETSTRAHESRSQSGKRLLLGGGCCLRGWW